ncbi:MAG: class I SAM-dependent methyltransferase [Nostoc sp. DedQUE12b]|uniref:class I SAM-dependent methyltransferase n=1 Tax=Nostoc sp. DedQUE12b TaxID=3075398 RepID=UPI002AD20F09|nr:class I SAM-dependent methyltransferase [Nostoc sp. DedQUE12b]MDZ8084039.1 class I SAM-dependent methyltransferase [Nostoc sp. DedQUE12b]
MNIFADNPANYYDLLFQYIYTEYHDEVVRGLFPIIRDSNNILEIGVGTGLVAERVLKLKPSCNLTGIDISKQMLDVAKKRLGNKIKLVESDVLNMQLEESFDLAYSNSGVWFFLDTNTDNEYLLCSSINSIENNVIALRRVAEHLKMNGLLVLSAQGMHIDRVEKLPGDIIHQVKVSKTDTGVKKQYLWIRENNGEIISDTTADLLILDSNKTKELMEQSGFEQIGIEGNKKLMKNFLLSKFHIYQKR